MREWWNDNACKGEPVDTFFDAWNEARALRICATCPVRDECRDDDLDVHAPSFIVGVRGGMRESERRKLWRARHEGEPVRLSSWGNRVAVG